MSSLKQALTFSQKKQAIIPLWWTVDGVCQCHKKEACLSPGKHPLWHKEDLPNGIVNATRDPAVIARWWRRWPRANVGYATGMINKVVVVDVDVRDGKQGMESLRELLPPDAPDKTFMVQSGSGGWHLYYRIKEPVNGCNPLLPGIELKGEGGYVVAPSSTYRDGAVYKVLNNVPAQWLPDVVLEVAKNGAPLGRGPLADYDPETGVYRIDPSIFGKATVSEEDWGKTIPDGERNVMLARLAGKLFRSDMPPAEVFSTLLHHNQTHCTPPKSRHEIKVIVRSVYRTMQRKDQLAAKESGVESVKPGKPVSPKQERAADDAFPLLTFSEFVDAYSNYDVSWDIEGWMPRSTICYAVAPPESWKTWFLTDWALALSLGRPFLGRFPVERTGPVILVQMEDSFHRLLRRIETILNIPKPELTRDGLFRIPMPDEPPLLFHVERRFSLADKDSVIGLDRKIRKHKAIGISFDPMFSILGDTRDYGAEGATRMKLLKLMRDHLDCSFLIAHHTRGGANGEGRGRDEAWGSQLLKASLESGWQIRPRDLPGSLSVERHFKDEPKPPGLHVQFTIDEENRYSVAVTEEARSEATLEDKIAEIINNEEITSLEQLMRRTGNKSKSQHQRALKSLGVGKLGAAFAIMRDFKLKTDDMLPKGLKE